MTEAERVLAEVATKIHSHSISYNTIREMTAPYLPKPEPDRLTVAARDVVALTAPSRVTSAKINGVEFSIVPAIRAIIAREVAAAGPSDEAIMRVYEAGLDYSSMWSITKIRAALKGEGA